MVDIQTGQRIRRFAGSTSIVKMASRASLCDCASSSGNYDNAPTNDIQQTEMLITGYSNLPSMFFTTSTSTLSMYNSSSGPGLPLLLHSSVVGVSVVCSYTRCLCTDTRVIHVMIMFFNYIPLMCFISACVLCC